MLAGAVDAVEGLLVLQADQPMVRGDLLHHLHGEEVMVDGRVRGLEDGGELVLRRRHLVVLGLGGDAELPELLVKLLHEARDGGTHRTEVVLLEFLPLAGVRAEQRAAGEDQVGTRHLRIIPSPPLAPFYESSENSQPNASAMHTSRGKRNYRRFSRRRRYKSSSSGFHFGVFEYYRGLG